MDPIAPFLSLIDPVLIAPYRIFENPLIGWWAGTFVLAFWSVLIGELTLIGVHRINRKPAVEYAEQTHYFHEQSLKAKQAGDEQAYRGINKLATEAYGKTFFLFVAMGMASLWPAFFAAAWLTTRFGDIVFTLPKWAGGLELSHIAPFIVCYICVRLAFSKIKGCISFLQFTPVAPRY
jgi:hypothetical protein